MTEEKIATVRVVRFCVQWEQSLGHFYAAGISAPLEYFICYIHVLHFQWNMLLIDTFNTQLMERVDLS